MLVVARLPPALECARNRHDAGGWGTWQLATCILAPSEGVEILPRLINRADDCRNLGPAFDRADCLWPMAGRVTVLRQEPHRKRVSLDQAIEIHAKALKHRFGVRAPLVAREKAHHCRSSGDHEGHAVWRKVAAVAEALLAPSRSDDFMNFPH